MSQAIRVFIGSSRGALPTAEKLEAGLKARGIQAKTWPQEFQLSDLLLTQLIEAAETYDYGVFVLAPDDVIGSGHDRRLVTRDNVLFELGLFLGRLGARRALVVVVQDKKLHLPADLGGLIYAPVHVSGKAAAETLRAACEKIADQVRTYGRRPEALDHLIRQVRPARSDRPAASSDDVHLHTFCGQAPEGQAPSAQSPALGRPMVFRLWADPLHPDSHIQAFLPSDASARRSRFQIRFHNGGDIPGDVTIRPYGQRAMKNPHGARFLLVDARAPSTSPENRASLHGRRPVVVAFRLIDGFATQWSYGDGTEDIRTNVELPIGDTWRTIALDLQDQQRWRLFDADGNHHYPAPAPRFETIAALIVEVGQSQVAAGEAECIVRPGKGAGLLELRRIRLSNRRGGPRA